MDAKEIKTALKAVKDSMEAKDFKTALKNCKTILKADRNNYLALVFFGASLQETEQRLEAPKAFKKAAEVSPQQTLAWKGLASYCEKYDTDKNKTDLLRAYVKLYVLETELKKCSDVMEKLENLLPTTLDEVTLKFVVTEIQTVSDDSKKKTLFRLLLCFMGDMKQISENLTDNYEMLLEDAIKLNQIFTKEENIEHYRKYLKLLYKKKPDVVLAKAYDMFLLYPDDVSGLEWICKVYSEQVANGISEVAENISIEAVYSNLLAQSSESYLALLCKGAYELTHGNLVDARDDLKYVAQAKPLLSTPWHLLCKCSISLFNFIDAEISAREALKLYEKAGKQVEDLLVWLIKSLSEQQNTSKSTEVISLVTQHFSSSRPDTVSIALVKANINLQNYAEAKTIAETITDPCYQKFLSALIQNYETDDDEKLIRLRAVLKDCPDSCDAWLELGKTLYSRNEQSECLTCFLKAAKLNPQCYISFMYLGHCYKYYSKDFEKARRCYLKVFQLNPRCDDAGMGLSDIYHAQGKKDLNLQLLSVAKQTPGVKWPWLRLGLHYLSLNQLEEAVESLRAAVRIDPNDQYSWESLADAYLSRGSYTSAMKSYERVVELNPDSLYPLLQIATIKQLLGLYEESVCQFRTVLLQNENYVPALKGHADACYSSMKNYLDLQLNGLAIDRCQEGIDSLVKCLKLRRDLVCFWKLLGDFCLTISVLHESNFTLSVPQWLISSTPSETDNMVELKKAKVLQLCITSYLCALNRINNHLLWYDLALAYNVGADFQDSRMKHKLRQSSLAAVKKSLFLKESWQAWNLLGILCSSKEIQTYDFAQHAFIKSLLLEENNPIVWTNLGALYVILGDLKLANQAFTEAQKSDPDYVECWIGQALIAETTGHHDAMDLFRHSTQLGVHPEGCIGYASMVCSTLVNTTNRQDKNYLYNIKNMNAITVASDALVWFTERIKNNPSSYNMLGLLLEHQKLYKKSAAAFLQALTLLQNKVQSDKDGNIVKEMDEIRCNYGRVLIQLHEYEEALTQMKQIKQATFANQCGLAIALFKSEMYEEAYNTYQSTLEWLAPDDCCKSQLLVALASVVYLFQGQNDAEVLLMQASQLKPPSVNGLFAYCALGMLHSNISLSELVLKELSAYKNNPQYLHHIAFFEAYIHLLKGENKEAVRTLCKTVHRHPGEPTLWLSLSQLLLQLYPSVDCKAAARSAELAMRSGRAIIDVSKILSLVSLSNLLAGSGVKSLKTSQKAVHMFPDKTENWIVLIASVYSRCLENPTTKEVLWLKKIITYVRRKLEASKQMTHWLSSYERKVNVLADQLLSRN